MPNPNQTMLNFPLTRKAKTLQQQSMSRSTSQDIPLQQFATPTSLLTNKHNISTPENMPFLNNNMVMIYILNSFDSEMIVFQSLLDSRYFFNFRTKC